MGISMKFQPGHKLAKGGARPGAGRKPKNHEVVKQAAAVLARQYIELHIEPVLKTYLDLAQSGNDSATTRHYVDKLLPNDHDTDRDAPIQIAIITDSRTTDEGHSLGVRVLGDDSRDD
jgi:hypothetical protein